jgi:hypothetical protein
MAQLPTSSLEESPRRWKEMLDELVAGECILCGEAMIRSIDEPFTTETEIASWA